MFTLQTWVKTLILEINTKKTGHDPSSVDLSKRKVNAVLISSNQIVLTDVSLLWWNSSFCLCWGFTAQSTQWGHVERGQFT